jgi:SAM-dependent methyltransferase
MEDDKLYMRHIKNWEYVAEHPDDDFVISKMAKENIHDMLYLIRPVALESILDFGCGIGRNFGYFKTIAETVDGYDLPLMIDRCKKMTKDLLVDNLYDDWDQVKNTKIYNITVAAFVFQFFGSIDEAKQYLTDIAHISYYLYFMGKVTMDNNERTDIIEIINGLGLYDIMHYTPEDKGHLNAVFRSRINKTNKPMLEISNQSNSYVTQWKVLKTIPTIHPTKPNALITIATGGYDEILDLNEESLIKYADKINADYIKITNKTQDWWGLEKFRTIDYAQYYDRVLFMDSDIYIRDIAPNIFDIVPIDEFGIFQEKEDLEQILMDILSREYRAMCRFLHMQLFPRLFINTGVMVFTKKHKNIFEIPTLPFKCYHCAEQDIVENNLLKNNTPIYKLPFELNCQIWSRRFKAEEQDAYFIHFSSINFKTRQKAFKKYILRK